MTLNDSIQEYQKDAFDKLLTDPKEKESRKTCLVRIVKQIFTILKNANQIKKEVPATLEKVTNFMFLDKMYLNVVENEKMLGPKIVMIILFISQLSTFVLTYSCVLSNLLQNKSYEPKILDKDNAFKKAIKVLNLTLVGPMYILIIEILSKIQTIVNLGLSLPPFSLFCTERAVQRVNSLYVSVCYHCFSLNEVQVSNLADQREIVQVFFESIPTGILKILVKYRFIICPGLLENGDSSWALNLAIVSTLISVIQTFYNFSLESESLQE